MANQRGVLGPPLTEGISTSPPIERGTAVTPESPTIPTTDTRRGVLDSEASEQVGDQTPDAALEIASTGAMAGALLSTVPGRIMPSRAGKIRI